MITTVVLSVAIGVACADKPPVLEVLDGWGTPTGFVVNGVVAASRPIHEGIKEDAIESFVDNAKALDADAIEGAEVSVVLAGRTYTTTTASDGFFEVRAQGLTGDARLTPGDVMVGASASLPTTRKSNVHIYVDGSRSIHIFDDKKPFVAVVSDIDDTIVHTFVTDKKHMIGAVLFKNGDTSDPIAGAASAFTKASSSGVDAFFYVSASPLQFHARLVEFLRAHSFPKGAVLLKRFGHDSVTDQQSYKMTRLEPLLAALPNMRVILIGDTGERDPETYAELRKRHPDRVVGIIIKKTVNSDVRPERFPDMTVVDESYPEDVVAHFVLPKNTSQH